MFWGYIHQLSSHRTFLSVGGTELSPIQSIKMNHNHWSQGAYRLGRTYFICTHNYTRKWYIVHFTIKRNSNVREVSTGWDDDTSIKYLKRYNNEICQVGKRCGE